MNTKSMITQGFRALVATWLAATLIACGGGGGSSDDDTAATSEKVVARGVITQLGSIKLNGVKYETPNGKSYSNDDSTSTVANYQVGQVVSLRGRRNDDGVTGTANEVEYEAEIEGAADVNGDINGIVILRTPTTNAPGIPDPLDNGTRYEVSGIWIDNTTIEATFIKEDDDSGAGGDGVDEIKGLVETVNSPTSFDVRGITYSYSGSPVVAERDLVEVHFNPATCSGSPLSCTATSVELEDDFFDQAEGLEIEIEGAVDLDTTGCPAAAEFKVDGVCIDSDSKPAQWMDGLTEFADLVRGSRVEAEGHMVSSSPMDYLRADKVKGRGNRVRVSSIAENVLAGPPCTFTLIEGNISVTILDCVDAFEGDTPSNGPLDISNLDGEEVEVRGVRTGPSAMMAVRVKADSLSGGGDRHELRAEVDVGGADRLNNELTVMGITSFANGFTELEVDDIEITPGNGSTTNADIDSFLGLIDDDTNPANGPRDVVEAGFDITTGDGTTTAYTADEWEIEEEDD